VEAAGTLLAVTEVKSPKTPQCLLKARFYMTCGCSYTIEWRDIKI
jgi:hypothetical protein